MKVYAVFKEGIYRHECGGIFGLKSLAWDAAMRLIQGETDDYHSYQIVEFTLDETSIQEIHAHSSYLNEPEWIVEFRRKGEVVTIEDKS